MARAITAEYTLNPPASSGQTLVSKKHTFEVGGASPNEDHYKLLRESIARARDEVGAELTVWRDKVGKAELSKETKKAAKNEEEDEEEGDGDGDDV
ncbi:hypothetical protein DFH07DRAFT_196642 [Mycena maculata]|uniref:Uncharacterized protein n=1 Tax=Mycena maculata TaxID=230809 RepID=A0AAD7KFK8_9AGAR|nr:hypothetical protein DFH07DRAFT_196642 [Mycena maculata]